MLEYLENLSPQEQELLKDLQIFELRPEPDRTTYYNQKVYIDIYTGLRESLGLTGVLEGNPLTQEHVAEALHSFGVAKGFYHLHMLGICMAFQTLLLYQVQTREGQFFDLITAMLNNSNPA